MLNTVEFVWGRNFVADTELVAVVAGMYGIIQPDYNLEKTNFHLLGVLSALFALGTLEELPSNEDIVRPKGNVIYIVFMILPLSLSIVSVVVSYRNCQTCLQIPETPLQLLVSAKETESLHIPESFSKNDKFPGDKEKLVFVPDLGIVPTKLYLEQLADR